MKLVKNLFRLHIALIDFNRPLMFIISYLPVREQSFFDYIGHLTYNQHSLTEILVDEKEYKKKYTNLMILKSVQDYLRTDSESSDSVYPVKVPDELFVQVLRLDGPEGLDRIIHHIFKIGLSLWNEKLYDNEFGSPAALNEFIDLVKRRAKAYK